MALTDAARTIGSAVPGQAVGLGANVAAVTSAARTAAIRLDLVSVQDAVDAVGSDAGIGLKRRPEQVAGVVTAEEP